MIFTDSKGRSIEIKDGFLCIEAYHDGTKIGCIEFDEIEVSDYQYFTRLSSMNVEDSYQKAGIGIEMMRLAAEIFGITPVVPYCPCAYLYSYYCVELPVPDDFIIVKMG
jgi:hypothetical protein